MMFRHILKEKGNFMEDITHFKIFTSIILKKAPSAIAWINSEYPNLTGIVLHHSI